MNKHTYAVHLIDYSKGFNPSHAFAEWLAWIECMAPYDIGIYE